MSKRPREEKPDWRLPLFFWRGSVRLAEGAPSAADGASAPERGGGGAGGSVLWDGSWVSSTVEEGLPPDASFSASPCTFSCAAELPLHPGSGAPLRLEALAGAIFSFSSSSYLLNNGDGLQRFKDEQHRVAFEAAPAEPAGAEPLGALLAGGQGTTEFGRFVSVGVAERVADGTLRFTLARRYLGGGDARLAWESAADALQACAAPVGGTPPRSELLGAPWGALPWRVPRERKAKQEKK